LIGSSREAVLAIRQTAAKGFGAVLAAETVWTRTLSVELLALGELQTDVGFGVAVEA
jgi:hypothetical protein